MAGAKKDWCKPCSKGNHNVPEIFCLEPCKCWCRVGHTQVFRPAPAVSTWHHQDMTEILSTLREHGVQCRATTEGKLLWKPQPKDLPDHVAALIRENRLLLALVLGPDSQQDLRQRPFWTHGTVSKCVGCGRTTIIIDPLGQHRHHWCGWVKQLAS